jgi:monooxygenase
MMGSRSEQGERMTEHLDVVIVGAGLSGIGAAVHLQKAVPGKRYAILEARQASGGTWDLFRYPGVRSDSDMYTLGYSFRPWPGAKAIADGPSILQYVRDTARDEGVDRHIRYDSRVVRAEWSSADARWTLSVQGADGTTSELTCGFLFMCSGYYRYDEGYTPTFAGVADFEGEVVHPQHWPEDLDYAGKKVVVIGSGATAVTLVPAMADDAAHVTMLQRSPTYIAARPAGDAVADFLRGKLPAKAAYTILRWKNVLLTMFAYQLSKRRPDLMKKLVRKGLEKELPAGFDIATHFTPPYNPWDQRFCIVPEGDLFRAIRDGKASIATGHIETFTPRGIRLTTGEELEADVVVTATGLQMLVFGGVQFVVDGEQVDVAKTVAYKGMMLSGVPNLAASVGYTNASWTLKCDLICGYVGGLLAHMDRVGAAQVTPVWTEASLPDVPFLDLQSGYVLRSVDAFPRQGHALPWRVHQNYLRDRRMFRPGSGAFDGLVFTPASALRPVPERQVS